MSYDGLPPELKEETTFCFYKLEPGKDGKKKKVPYQTCGARADPGNKAYLTDFTTAYETYRNSPGESIRTDGKYQYKYHIDGKPHFVYSWKLEPTDKLPPGKKPCLSLRELEKQVNSDLDRLMNVADGTMTVCELVDRYLKTKTGVRQSTRTGYVTVQRILEKGAFRTKENQNCENIGCKIVFNKVATGGWQELQLHSHHKGRA